MNSKTVTLHPEFPEKVWVVIEQPRNEPYRFAYDPLTGTFARTTYKSLIYDRGFSGAYGWIGGLGTPPEPHYDVILFTQQNPQPGDILLSYLCGMFYRGDGDHKFVAIDSQLIGTVTRPDLATLDQTSYGELMALYPHVGEKEGWRGVEEAIAYLKTHKPSHD